MYPVHYQESPDVWELIIPDRVIVIALNTDFQTPATIDHRWPDDDGWAPLFDPYYEHENDLGLIPTRRLVPVTKRIGRAFEHLVDLETIAETDEIDDSNEADQD